MCVLFEGIVKGGCHFFPIIPAFSCAFRKLIVSSQAAVNLFTVSFVFFFFKCILKGEPFKALLAPADSLVSADLDRDSAATGASADSFFHHFHFNPSPRNISFVWFAILIHRFTSRSFTFHAFFCNIFI